MSGCIYYWMAVHFVPATGMSDVIGTAALTSSDAQVLTV